MMMSERVVVLVFLAERLRSSRAFRSVALGRSMPSSATRVHDTFLALDLDMNGMLSRSEFSEISNRTMSPLGATSCTGQARTGTRWTLTAFADFVLAWDHRSHPAAIKYFFPVLDLKNQGFVTPAEIYTFFKEIHVMWVNMGKYADLAIYSVVDEILDMVKPKTATLITAEGPLGQRHERHLLLHAGRRQALPQLQLPRELHPPGGKLRARHRATQALCSMVIIIY
ncbi:predicted protein [Haematococcus lacustris]|uniref:EF-hand domain-containing protein n=1 Tax=Haematococcus lacustris TaxID=44745 RepID=A0A699Z0Z8_HAELA|nr:predicted protein [Haematococcus lacustris]